MRHVAAGGVAALIRRKPLLFVYGSLMSGNGGPMARLLACEASLIAAGSIGARLYDFGAYPGACASGNAHDRVHGELHALHHPARMLPLLDRYELCDATSPQPHPFARRQVDVCMANGARCRAWSYLYVDQVPARRRIASGRWQIANRPRQMPAAGATCAPPRTSPARRTRSGSWCRG